MLAIAVMIKPNDKRDVGDDMVKIQKHNEGYNFAKLLGNCNIP